MPESDVLKAAKLLMVLGLWSLPVLAQAPAKLPAAAADMLALPAQGQKVSAAAAPASAQEAGGAT
ncbi:MAG: hypothetical protein ABSC10_21930, partial [Candidatus Acidiferrales bacterium]